MREKIGASSAATKSEEGPGKEFHFKLLLDQFVMSFVDFCVRTFAVKITVCKPRRPGSC